MAWLTAAALGVVGFFAYQASAAMDGVSPAAKRPGSSASPTTSDKAKQETAVPARSGSGERVVYSLKRKRVWLIGAGDKVQRTFEVWPSSVSPPPDTYRVTTRTRHVTGSDGVPVENVVRFANVEGTVIGFSSALDGSTPDPESDEKTGGIREREKDGQAMWLFATTGTKVVVVP
ncbi:hypothetical protein DVA86_04645 [Streptomyces armeniacus]|uniref:L,D-transpeptidase n=1 Tax=Streptomyces armeniacus TaxID=83291 RepID=A0A345XK81_9ACTN|nr:hypothetical protein DVA86_04645 [Streptomyces armeniacus]